jgi:anti-sigma B factor antagonist
LIVVLIGSNVTPSFNIETFERDRSLVLVVEGELDLSTAPWLDDELARAAAGNAATIVIDLDYVDFIDSSGLQVLIKHGCREKHHNRIRLTKGSLQARRLFQITGALDHLPFVSED